jgi:3-oxoacyl-[acyl-carrier-protein] synthase III
MSADTTIIESLGIYLPPQSVSTAQMLNECTNRIRLPFEALTGIHSRRVAGETDFAIDLAEKAILDCLRHSRHSATDIDVLVSTNICRCDGPDLKVVYEPSTSARLKQRLGFANALAFDLNSACAGMFTGIHVVDAMIRAGTVRRGLVVSGEYITHLARTAQKEIEDHTDERLACLTLGDAGAAVILEGGPSGGAGLKGFELFTLGEFSSCCIALPTDKPHGGFIMRTDMATITAMSNEHGNGHPAHLMQRCGWDYGEIDHILGHQTSKVAIDAAARDLRERIGREVFQRINVINNLRERGNTASNSHFVALGDKIRSGVIRDGDKIVFGIRASGLTIGTALYEFDDLPSRLSSPSPAKAPAERPLAGATQRYFPANAARRVRIEAAGTFFPAGGGRLASVDLLAGAATKCLAAASRSIDDVDLLIQCGVYRSDFVNEPAIATLAAGRLGLGTVSSAKKALAFDVMNGALGFLDGCFCGISMLQAGRHRQVMVAAAEVENNAGIPSLGLRGLREGASAVLLGLGEEGGEGFGGFLFCDHAEHIDSFETHMSNHDGNCRMVFPSRGALEPAYLACLEGAFRNLLEREGIEPGKVAAVLPPQVSRSFVASLRERLPVKADVVIDASCGQLDCFTSSLACSLEELRRTRPPRAGDIAIILGVAAGIQAAAAVYRF